MIRSEGKAVPEIVTTKRENLFPHFTTMRKPINGFWEFPSMTTADDTLYFRSLPIREKLVIRYDDYKEIRRRHNGFVRKELALSYFAFTDFLAEAGFCVVDGKWASPQPEVSRRC